MTPSKVASLVFLFALALVATASGQVFNGGFENGLAGWTAVPGGGVTVRNAGSPEALFPSEGAQFAEVRTFNNGDAVPGYGPHAAGTGSGPDMLDGTADGVVTKLSTTALRPDGASCVVSIDWTFFQDEGDDVLPYNDFLSIDVLDDLTGAFIANLVFVDTGLLAGLPFYSNVPGAALGDPRYLAAQEGSAEAFEVAPHGFKRAEVEIGPLTAPGQVLRIEIAVGNVDDASVNCRALVDDLRVSGGVAFPGGFGVAPTLRVLGNPHFEGAALPFDTGGDFAQGRYRTRLLPGETFALRAFNLNAGGGTPWALLAGDPIDAAVDFGFGGLSLDLTTPIVALFDGINPVNAADVLLGTLGFYPSYYSGAIPGTAQPGTLALQGIIVDPTNPPFNLGLTPLTEIEGAQQPQIPRGTTDVVDATGVPLAISGSGGGGLVSLASLNGGAGFPFYGSSYTEVAVSSQGMMVFGGAGGFPSEAATFLSGPPAIAPIFDFFSTSPTSEIRSKADPSGGVVTISWVGLGSGVSPETNSFSVQLDQSGAITFFYGALATPGGLIGLSPGGMMITGLGGLLTNFSSNGFFGWSPGSFFPTAPSAAVVETYFLTNQPGALDYLDAKTFGGNGPSRLTFFPNDDGSFDVVVGTR